MTDICGRAFFADVEHFLQAVSEAPLLSACGGPYPERPDVEAVTSLSSAIELIRGAMLDATAHQQLDRAMVDAYRAARAVLAPRWLRWWVALTGNPIRLERMICARIEELLASALLPELGDRIIIEAHLSELFTVTALLVHAGILASHRGVALATCLAIDGYLPVDLVVGQRGSAEHEYRVLIH